MKKIVFFKQGRLRIVSLVVSVFFEVVLAPLHDSKKEKDKNVQTTPTNPSHLYP